MLRLSNIRHLTVHWHKQNKYEGAKLNTGACYYIYWNYQDFILTFILKHKGNTGLWPIYITKLFFGLKVFVNICQKKKSIFTNTVSLFIACVKISRKTPTPWPICKNVGKRLHWYIVSVSCLFYIVSNISIAFVLNLHSTTHLKALLFLQHETSLSFW